jgi:uncharacterized protein
LLDAGADFVGRVLSDVLGTFARNWPYLLLSILIAAALSVYVGTERMGNWLRRRTSLAVLGAVGLATLTPFCSCGTMAIVLGLLASTAPWAPIVAFMVSSPLTSPAQLVLSGGLFGWPFALTYFLGAAALGLAAGGVTHVVERMGWLKDQARIKPPEPECRCRTTCCSCTSSRQQPTKASIGPGAASKAELPTWPQRLKLKELRSELWTLGRQMLIYFFAFVTVGYALIELVPSSTVSRWLGGDSVLSVVIAALLGIPIYITTDGSLPMIRALMDGGMGPGPAIAFLITGAGTSVGAVGGMLVIARARVVALIVGILVIGAIMLGLLANVILG